MSYCPFCEPGSVKRTGTLLRNHVITRHLGVRKFHVPEKAEKMDRKPKVKGDHSGKNLSVSY